MLLVYFVIAAIPIGYLAGGSLRNIRYAHLRFAILPIAAFLLEASFGLIGRISNAPPSEWLGKVVCLEYLLLTLFIWINHRIKGMDMLGAATFVNFLVIWANGYRMPVTPIIYQYPELQHFVERIQSGELPEYVLVDWNKPLWFLGDTLPLGNGLASIGDLMMALGVLTIIVTMMKSEPPHRKHHGHYSRRSSHSRTFENDRIARHPKHRSHRNSSYHHNNSVYRSGRRSYQHRYYERRYGYEEMPNRYSHTYGNYD